MTPSYSKFDYPDWKLLLDQLQNKKLPLHSWRPLVHKTQYEVHFHLQGPKFNMYVHFPLEIKQLNVISSPNVK